VDNKLDFIHTHKAIQGLTPIKADIIYDDISFIKLVHLFLNLDEENCSFDQSIIISLQEVNFKSLILLEEHTIPLNTSKSIIIKLLTKLIDKLYKHNMLISLNNFNTYIRLLCRELISQYGIKYNISVLPTEKSYMEEEEKTVINHVVSILEYFSTSLLCNVSLSIFSENSKE
jgi:hypothetical protein